MKKCIKQDYRCIGREYSEQSNICCQDEILEERELVESIIDCIDDCLVNKQDVKKLSSRLSYGAYVINKKNDESLLEIFQVIKRFSLLMYEFEYKILNDDDINEFFCSFANEIKKWFQCTYLDEDNLLEINMLRKSLVADIYIIEQTLGVCMIDEPFGNSVNLDDLFF